jgi:predicted metal-dependent phosphoesterase TrpH
VDYEALERDTQAGAVNRLHFATELTRLGYTESIEQAFRELLEPKRGLYQPPARLGALETIEFIRSIGAVSVLAHPFLSLDSAGKVEEFLREAVPAGLDAMEVRYSKYDRETTETALELASAYGLLCSGGSDYHGINKPGLCMGTGYGNLSVPMEYYEKMAALAEKRQKGWTEI